MWRATLTILVALRKMFLLADLLIAVEIWRTQSLIIARTFDFLTSPSTNCNLRSNLFEEKIFDNHVHFAIIRRKNTRNEDKLVKFSCWSILSCFLFSSCDDRLVSFVVVGSGSAVDTGSMYILRIIIK